PNKKAVGLFLVVGFSLFLGLIGQTIFHKIHTDTKDLAVMYFSESLQGLTEGSPVIFQGVEVGKVTRIVLVTNKNDLNFHVAVYARFKETDIISEGSLWEKLWKKDKELDFLDIMIKEGLRARLASQSYLTGQLRIDLVMLPDTEATMFESPKKEDIPQIPTVLSQKEELVRGLNRIKIQETLEKINTVAETLGKELPALLPALTNSAKNLDQTLERVSENTDETLSNLNETLHDVSNAAKSTQNLTDYLEQHPESLIRGKKGE
ncbi:MAG: MCE family protein, partial [Elusimicrobiaceae bacterium]|nr:MCE family protein [Elusimicrobiaceae bacterium]